MKKFISLFLVVLSLISILSINTFAQDKISEPALVIGDEIIEEVYGLYNTNNNSDVSLASTGLITNKSLKLAKTTDKLLITAKTTGSADVTKNYIYHGTVYGKNGTGGTAA